MANLDYDYSLTEVSQEIGVPDAWVRRWEKVLNLKGSSGQKGKRSVYTEEVMKILQRIRVLQIVELSNADIKRLWALETTIKGLDRVERGKINERFYYFLHVLQPERAIVLDIRDFDGNAERIGLLRKHRNFYKVISLKLVQIQSLLEDFGKGSFGAGKINVGRSELEHSTDLLAKLDIADIEIPSETEHELRNPEQYR